ncbi:hypothetical protein HPP92_022280, partial [Vanilla planifolia]
PRVSRGRHHGDPIEDRVESTDGDSIIEVVGSVVAEGDEMLERKRLPRSSSLVAVEWMESEDANPSEEVVIINNE